MTTDEHFDSWLEHGAELRLEPELLDPGHPEDWPYDLSEDEVYPDEE